MGGTWTGRHRFGFEQPMPGVNGPCDRGYPCWVDLMTPDIDRAAVFYAKILDRQYLVTGAEFRDDHLTHLDDRSAAGMGPAQNGMSLLGASTSRRTTSTP